MPNFNSISITNPAPVLLPNQDSSPPILFRMVSLVLVNMQQRKIAKDEQARLVSEGTSLTTATLLATKAATEHGDTSKKRAVPDLKSAL